MKYIIDEIDRRSSAIIKILAYKNFFWGLIKIVLALLSRSISMFIYSFYNIGIGIAKRTSLKEAKKHDYETYQLVGNIVLISSLFYVIYSTDLIVTGENKKYSIFMAIIITVFTVVDFIFSIIGLISAKKKENIEKETIKLVNLSSSFISLSIAINAILSFNRHRDISKICGVCGIILGILASLVGLYMIEYTNMYKKKKSFKK